MTLKPPTRTLPKLFMKDWPEKDISDYVSDRVFDGVRLLTPTQKARSLSDFTRVLEGVEGQKETPLRKQEPDHD